ncbi:MAG: 16S rRNA (uracil(1498)-N(3))-methyltransferase [Cyanobium sp. MED843]|nr:16S rRNA (uracil(1498)-N(3))-methyltransferase [Cyanobium sp. MED843]
MAELRRLLIAPDRLDAFDGEAQRLVLEATEQHYLRRVLRCRVGDEVAVVDGVGSLWTARLTSGDALTLPCRPDQQQPRQTPRLGLAMALIRRGFDDALRMACELGVDEIQPLHCERCVPQAEYRSERWRTILQEAVEQCERLWMPTLHPLRSLQEWAVEGSRVALGVTRDASTQAFGDWLTDQGQPPDKTEPHNQKSAPHWMVIGPEGGWSVAEEALCAARGWSRVHLGEPILRSSTAAVCSAVELVRWRQG